MDVTRIINYMNFLPEDRDQFCKWWDGCKVFTVKLKLLIGRIRYDATMNDNKADSKECIIQARLSLVVNT